MQKFWQGYTSILKGVIYFLAALSAIGLFAMILVTCADVSLRVLSRVLKIVLSPSAAQTPWISWIMNGSIKGSVDIVTIGGALMVAGALPYTTAVKGHIAVEYFFLKLGQRGRMIVDTVARILVITLFGMLAWRFLLTGNAKYQNGEVSGTIDLPIFWVYHVIAFTCVVVIFIKFYHLLHPGKTLIKL